MIPQLSPVGTRVAERAAPPDRGAGSVLAIAIIAAILGVCAVLLPLATAVVVRHRAAAAADAAALAGADAASGWRAGAPCEAAARLAAQNGATLSRCEVEGVVVTVEVVITAGLGGPTAGEHPLASIRQSATAGPANSAD